MFDRSSKSLRHGSAGLLILFLVIALPRLALAEMEKRVVMKVGEQISLSAGGHFYVIRQTGEIQDQEQYGGASVNGYDGEIGATYAIRPKIVIRAGARYATFNYLFNGSGNKTDRDNNQQQDIARATDSYLSIQATLGYLY